MSAEAISDLPFTRNAASRASPASHDVRELLASSDPRAKMALDYFAYRIALFAGCWQQAMQGLDGDSYSRWVGENAAAVREAVRNG